MLFYLKQKLARLLVIFVRIIGRYIGVILRIVIPFDQKIKIAILCQKVSLSSPGKTHFLSFFLCYEVVRNMFFLSTEKVYIQKVFENNILMRLDITQKTQIIIALSKIYELSVTNFIKKNLKKGQIFIDVGANIGYYTLLASEIVGPDGIVFSFEPEQDNFNNLVYNFNLNKLDNVVLNNLAIGSKKDKINLHINPLNDGGHSLVESVTYADDEGKWNIEDFQIKSGLKEKFQEVNMVSLDSYVSEKNIDLSKKTIIKIDVEGFERDVLIGMSNIINKYNPMIICEVGVNGLDISMLTKCKYQPFKVDKNGELTDIKYDPEYIPKGDYIFKITST